MRFFGRNNNNNKKELSQPSSSPAEKRSSLAERKEPLIAPTTRRQQQQQQQQLQQQQQDELPDWTDIDGTKAAAIQRDVEQAQDIAAPHSQRRFEKESTSQQVFHKTRRALLWILGCGGGTVTTIKLIAWGLAAAGLTLFVVAAAAVGNGNPSYVIPAVMGRTYNVAFVGNSYFFVNDLPRLMEQVAGSRLYQNSCLHGSGSLLNILKTGNGMYYKWQTQNAMDYGGKEWTVLADDGSTSVYNLYDMGACSVPQLLTGNDRLLSYGNEYGHYVDDGTNPCLMDEEYMQWQQSRNETSKTNADWDYVVMVDQSKRMCFDEARNDALMSFNYTYAPLLNRIRATPILVQPHAFWSDSVNMTGLNDVPTFTYLIYQGAQVYQDFLNDQLKRRRARIAPVGNAFLAVWEYDTSLWQKLFLDDGIHPSGYGSYLYSLVIYATIYNSMPPRYRVVTNDIATELFGRARKLHSNSTMIPNAQDASTLWKLARNVAIHGYQPSSLASLMKGDSSSSSSGSSSSSNTQDSYQQDEEDNEEDDGYYNQEADDGDFDN